MTAFLDTSLVVRYLSGEPEDQADRAAELIEGAEDFIVTETALAEAAYTLSHFYQFERSTLVDALIAFVGRTNIQVGDLPKWLAIDALLLCRPSNRVSFADGLIWAAARHSSDGRMYTFDRRFPAAGVARVLLR